MEFELDPELKSLLDRAVGGLQTIKNGRFLFSSILYQSEQGSKFLITKNATTPSFLEDWKVYLMFKAVARTNLTTGTNVLIVGRTLRNEIEIGPFLNNSFSICNFKDIQDYYQSTQKGPQSVFILSNSFTDEDVDRNIDTTRFKPVLIERQGEKSRFQTIKKQPTLNQYFLELEKLGAPVLLQFGTTTLQKYFKEEQPLIDLILLTIFTGKLGQQHIGEHFDTQWTSKYKLAFKSEPFPHALGELQFFVYTLP